MDIDIWELLTDNEILIFNILSVELGLLVGMWLRSRFIEKDGFSRQNITDFLMFSLVLIYGTLVATFSNWPIPILGYAAGGIVLPPFTLPLYNMLVAAAPNLVKNLLPEKLIKWVLENTKPPTKTDDTGVK